MRRIWYTSYCLLAYALINLSVTSVSAQILYEPEPQFTAPCASASFNSFQVRFKWDPPVVNNDNQFILELSEPDGSWDNPTTLASVADKNADFDFYFTFGFPNNTAGENYKVRVKSTSPELTSPESDAFPAYYQNVTEGLVINNFVGEIYVCDGTPATLTINNYPSEHAYNWYRDGSLIPGERGPTLTTSQAGFYYVEVDYGLYCSGSTLSNQVEVITGSAQGVTIQGSYPQSLCAGETHTLQASVTDPTYLYQWYKDNNPISGANAPSYVIDTNADPNFDGQYAVEIQEPGGCAERSAPVTINKTGDFTINLTTPNSLVLLPGGSRTLGVTTSAVNPTYVWYRDGSVISGETQSNITVNQPGTYWVTVTQGGSCVTSEDSEQIVVEVPDSFDITIETDSNYTDCSNTSASLSVSQINAITPSNGTIDVTADVIGSFGFQWFKDGVALSGETASTIAVNDASENGNYRIDGTLGPYSSQSNQINVKLIVNDNITISASEAVVCDGGNTVTLSVASFNPAYTYEWYHNGVQMPENGETVNTNLSGTYRLAVTAFGCTKLSNEVVVQPFDESVVSVDAPDRVVFVEGGYRTVTASGADSYQWYNSDNELLSGSSSYTFTEEGDYVLRAFIGSCEVTKLFTVAYLETFAVPNVITPNGDGVNDQWIIPNRYSFNNEVEVTIYDPAGKPIFNAVGYQNNWPQSSLSFPTTKPPVFYYKIVKGKNVLKQGTITLIR